MEIAERILGTEHVCTVPPHSVILGFAHDPFRVQLYDVRFGFYDIPLKDHAFADFLCKSLSDTSAQA